MRSFQSDSVIARAREIRSALQEEALRNAGLWRDRSRYILNIAYPSLQAMGPLCAKDLAQGVCRNHHKPRPVALYIHIPFCTGLCHYCHYFKIFGADQPLVYTYVNALLQELDLVRKLYGELSIQSLYFGGGTPSYLPLEYIDALLEGIYLRVHGEANAEITFEVHPEHASPELFALLKAKKVTRINFGVESFNNELLKGEHRRHTADQARDAYGMAVNAGFENINLDFIYGLQHQTLEDWCTTLATALALEPASICAYYMRIKAESPTHKLFLLKPETFASEEDLLLMHIVTFEMLEEAGYRQEIVDWFVRHRRFIHRYQLHNWQRTDTVGLLGIGVSAYSYAGGFQYYNINDIKAYIQQVGSGILPVWRGERFASVEEKMRRTLMLGLKANLSRRDFFWTYGMDPVKAFPHEFALLVSLGLLWIAGDSIVLSYRGRLFADEIGQLFYSPSVRQRMQAINPVLLSTTSRRLNA